MDNVTHSLFGAAVSESLWHLLPQKTRDSAPPATRKLLLYTSVIANNIPDLDVFYSRLLHSNPQLGGLLHHRGHTHTLPIAFLEGLLILGIVRLLQFFWKGLRFRTEWRWISFLAFLGPLTHIALDGLNNYGVHPFWPIDSTWKYLDWVFVLEPWFWVTFSFFLFSTATSKKSRRLYAVFPILGAILSWSLGAVPLLMNTVFSLWALIMAFFLWKLNLKHRVLFLWTAIALILFSFEIGHRKTRAIIVSQIGSEETFKIEDLSLTPLPLNPLCWAVVAIESNSSEYRLRRAITAPFPSVLSLSTCTELNFFSPEIRSLSPKDHTLWEAEHLLSIPELESLWREYCDVRDFLQFARAPYFWIENENIYFSDLRFERKGRKSFSRIKIRDISPPCKPSKAPWLSPLKRFRSFDQSSESF